MIRRFSSALALATIIVVFVGLFVVLDGAAPLIRLGAPAVLGVLAAAGVRALTAPTQAQIRDDAYADDARGRVQACLALVRQIDRASRDLRSYTMREVGTKIRTVVPELLRRVEATAPLSVYSSAAQLEAHLTSLLGVVTTFADVEANPSFHHDPVAMMKAGEAASERFLEFALDSIKLVNAGDMAAYTANLDTVAPPKMPSLDAPETGIPEPGVPEQTENES